MLPKNMHKYHRFPYHTQQSKTSAEIYLILKMIDNIFVLNLHNKDNKETFSKSIQRLT